MDAKRRHFWLILGMWLGVLSNACGQGTTNAASSTNAPPSAPAAIALADVVTSAVADTTKLQTLESSLTSDDTASQADDKLPAITQEIDQEQAKETALIASKPSLATLRTAASDWQSISDEVAALKQPLSDRLAALDQTVADLADMDKQWRATLKLASAPSASTPADILARINTVIAAISRATRSASDLRANILSAQNRVAGQETRIAAGLDAITVAENSAMSLLLTRDNPPLWTMFSAHEPAAPGGAIHRSPRLRCRENADRIHQRGPLRSPRARPVLAAPRDQGRRGG
jgi:hypothetical protein